MKTHFKDARQSDGMEPSIADSNPRSKPFGINCLDVTIFNLFKRCSNISEWTQLKITLNSKYNYIYCVCLCLCLPDPEPF